MRRDQFTYQLPDHLIARQPPAARRDSRLLALDGVTGAIEHGLFPSLLERVNPGDLMVFNNTRVIPARLFGHKATGGKIEVLVERVLDNHRVQAQIRASKSPGAGMELMFDGGFVACTAGRDGDLFELVFYGELPVMDILSAIGHVPLPPYIDRVDTAADRERYQTVYATRPGAVAAPTAGLHFDEPLLAQLRDKGVQVAFTTLHVGAGTFQPVRVEDIREHKMHSEVIDVTAELCAQVEATHRAGKRVIAVGTTSVRCLEAAAARGAMTPVQGETDIFIYPGYEFRVVDALVTNFHLPESTLLMLVSAFAGYAHTLAAYRAAVEREYRFFSYGDAMFITRNPQTAQLSVPQSSSGEESA